MHWYLHVDMDAFFASVEQALNLALKGKLVVVGGNSGRGVVTSASYEARKYGVHSAMPGFQARKLCPHAIFLPNRHALYREYSGKVFAILKRYSPEVQAISIDEGIVNLTGTERLLGSPLKTSHEIITCIQKELGLSASGGLSTNRVVAKIAATSAKPHGLIYVPAGSEENFLYPLPTNAIPGVGAKTHREFLRRGIQTVGDLLRYPELSEHYLGLKGPQGKERSRDHSIGSETTVDRPLKKTDNMERVIWTLVEEVGGRLREESYFARCITLKIRYSDFTTITRSLTLSVPTCFDREIFGVARALLIKNLHRGRAVRLLGISASHLQGSGWQEPLLDRQNRRSWERLYRGVDHLRDKYGEDAVHIAATHTEIR
jgi:DNA polymerase-4